MVSDPWGEGGGRYAHTGTVRTRWNHAARSLKATMHEKFKKLPYSGSFVVCKGAKNYICSHLHFTVESKPELFVSIWGFLAVFL
jgi:hypothetical protein